MGYQAHQEWMEDIRREGRNALEYARAHYLRIIILAGRPYHVDPEINHGLEKIITGLGMRVRRLPRSPMSVSAAARRPSIW